MIGTYFTPRATALSLLDVAIFASVSAMSVFALFSPMVWGLS